MRHLKTSLAVIGAVTVLVLAGNTIALAATGQALLLGKTNYANAVTTVERTNAGPAFKITNDTAASAPFVTNGTGKVVNLNADKVDGIDADALKTTAYVYRYGVAPSTTSVSLTIPVPVGDYIVSYSAYLSGATNGAVDCYLEQDPASGTSMFQGESRFDAGAQSPALGGTAFLSKTAVNTLELHCTATNAFVSTSSRLIQIVATPVGTVAANEVLAAD